MSDKELIEANFKMIQADLEDMKISMHKIADALTKIAVLEEKHQIMQASMGRMVEKLDLLDTRQNQMELAQVKQSTTIHVSLRAIQIAWAVLGSGLMYGVWQLIKIVAAQGA